MPKKKWIVELDESERDELLAMINKGKASALSKMCALLIFQAAALPAPAQRPALAGLGERKQKQIRLISGWRRVWGFRGRRRCTG